MQYRYNLGLLFIEYTSSVREKKLRLGAKFVSSIIHAFFSRAEFPVYLKESQ